MAESSSSFNKTQREPAMKNADLRAWKETNRESSRVIRKETVDILSSQARRPKKKAFGDRSSDEK